MTALYLRQWCHYRGLTFTQISDELALTLHTLQSLSSGEMDPPLSLLTTMAEKLRIPTAWLFYDPHVVEKLWNDLDDEQPTLPLDHASDPIFECMLQARRQHPDVFTLLTTLIHHDDPKLIRAAHVNLQSLSKQIRRSTVPWGSRPPGHFEPPSD